MFSFVMFAALIAGPYPFEAAKGLVVEPVVGSTFSDKIDSAAITGGARFSYFRPSETDSFVTVEMQFLAQNFSRRNGANKTREMKWTGDESLAFYEIFNPYAFRVVGGIGVEYRDSDFSPLGYYRAGLGRFFKPKIAVFADIGQRQIFRESKRSFPLEGTLSASFTF